MRILILCVCAALFSGCREKGFQPADLHYTGMAVDAAYRIRASSLPARTEYYFDGTGGNEVFNASFVSKLREFGYAVSEAGEGEGAGAGVRLKANALRVGERQFLVLVDVDETQMQRGFDLLDSDITPNSYWMVRHEDGEDAEYSVKR